MLGALLMPLLTGAVTLTQKKPLRIHRFNVFGNILTCGFLAAVLQQLITGGVIHEGMLYVDELSGVLLLTVLLLSFTATLFSASYMKKELEHGNISPKMLPRYYGLLQLFISTMIGVLIVENLGLIWVAVEATTLASALLVAFYFNRAALEAAWKYVMVCTVGICMALLGTILLYYAQVNAMPAGGTALSWLQLRELSGSLDPNMVKLALIFILIGYGTKAGLAPMHTWLPDAHSQAPSPVSALLSGALLSCALYAILRNVIVVNGALGGEFSSTLLIAFGLFSIIIAIPFILVQHDVKRLLAYSSVEHMGLITFGIGIGTPLAVYGALLHIVNHALAKSMLFYLAGIITQEYRTKHILRIRGLVSAMPLVGTLFIIGILAITGVPPFNVFVSKFMIAWSAFESNHLMLGSVLLILLTAVFGGMVYYLMKIGFGSVPHHGPGEVRIGWPARTALFLSLAGIVVAGLYLPPWFNSMLIQAAAIVTGG